MKFFVTILGIFLISISAAANQAEDLTKIRDIFIELNSQVWPVTYTSKLALPIPPAAIYASKSALTVTGEYDSSERANGLFDETEKKCFESQRVGFRAAFDKFKTTDALLLKGFQAGRVYSFKISLFDVTAIGEDGLKKYPQSGYVGFDFKESNPPSYGLSATALLRQDKTGRICVPANADMIFDELKKYFKSGN